jgi:Mg2+/Co2+ transporter CorB
LKTETLHLLIAILVGLILLSAFFSAVEIGMMSLNRYRLRNLVRKHYRPAQRVNFLLQRPDRLLGMVLIGNNFANIVASAIATVIAVHFFGPIGVMLATVVLTLLILIFAEITPKTLAALYPEKVAFRSSLILKGLLYLLYPVVWIVNGISNGILRLLGISVKQRGLDTLSHEELRTILREATGKPISGYQEMLLRILDLEKVTVEDIMVPRNDILGIDLEKNWESVLKKIETAQHTRLPVFRESIDHIEGILHLRRALPLLRKKRFSEQDLLSVLDTPYFVPLGTSLNMQLLNFRQKKLRSAFVVDEYGDIQGLVTLEDILEEIVGEFTTSLTGLSQKIIAKPDGSFLVDGGVSVRELNRMMHWEFPIKGAKTLNGIIVEYLESLPSTGVSLRLAGYPIEIIEVEENTVKTARIWPKLRKT